MFLFGISGPISGPSIDDAALIDSIKLTFIDSMKPTFIDDCLGVPKCQTLASFRHMLQG